MVRRLRLFEMGESRKCGANFPVVDVFRLYQAKSPHVMHSLQMHMHCALSQTELCECRGAGLEAECRQTESGESGRNRNETEWSRH